VGAAGQVKVQNESNFGERSLDKRTLTEEVSPLSLSYYAATLGDRRSVPEVDLLEAGPAATVNRA
jgi:hypothetical protein